VKTAGGGFLSNVRQISAFDGDTTCGVKGKGTVRCWGENSAGQLGDGTTDPRPFPVTTTVLASGAVLTAVKAVAVQGAHSCALRSNGRAWCWGFNGSGRLGDGTTDDRHAAVQVRRGGGFLTGVVAISAGLAHTCALLADATVRCWGDNDEGQLGDGTTDERHAPVKVRNASGGVLSGVVAISAGYDHTCALRADRRVSCWGNNEHGRLGDGSTQDRHHPVQVKRGSGALSGVTHISAGDGATCAATIERQAYCWGNNENGELGDGTTTERHKARLVKRDSRPFAGVQRIETSADHTCAVRSNKTAWCWGANSDGQVGSGSAEPKVLFPERVDFP
jgi:alpha-tubulin suppressor-like RCC1 family protein